MQFAIETFLYLSTSGGRTSFFRPSVYFSLPSFYTWQPDLLMHLLFINNQKKKLAFEILKLKGKGISFYPVEKLEAKIQI